MPLFWVLAGLLALAATLLVAWPLITRRSPVEALSGEDERRLAVYRDRRDEIRRDRDAGRIDADEAARAERELLAEASAQFPGARLDTTSAQSAPARSRPLAWALIVALVVPLTAVTAYHQLGSPSLIGLDAAALRGELSAPQLDRIVAELRQRVADKPDDGEGWMMLAEALKMQSSPTESVDAYARAAKLLPDNARLLADYAEARVIAGRGQFDAETVAILERALRADSQDGKAIAMMGAAQYRLGNLEEALKHLRRLVAALPDDTPESARLREAVAGIEAELAARSTGGTASGPSQSEAPVGLRASEAGGLAGSIALDASLKGRVSPGMTVFVVARPADGSRMPIAALRLQAGQQWPLQFALTDAQAMNPARPLSSVDSVVLEARISASGNAARGSGDLFGTLGPVKPGARDLMVRIDQRVP